jgi:hypothetical protein
MARVSWASDMSIGMAHGTVHRAKDPSVVCVCVVCVCVCGVCVCVCVCV